MERLTLDTKEVMEATGWGRDFVRQLIRSNALPNVGTHRKILIPRKALDRYLENPTHR